MRSVPHLIDSNSRLGEYLMVFMVPLFLLRTVDALGGLLAGAALCAVYVRTTLGRPDGYLAHRLYRLGLPVRGLLPIGLRRLVP